VSKLSAESNAIQVQIEINGKQETITGSHLLVAAGRRVNVDGLGLEKAGVDYSRKGIVVDKRLRTSNRRIYAIGDVAGGYQFTHIANYHAGIVIRNILFRLPAKVDYKSLPWVTYTLPELAHAGLTSEAALKQDPDAKIISCDLSEIDRAQAEHDTTGKIKLIASKKGKVLGVSILAPHAGEMILPWVMMIREGRSLRSLTDAIVPYPTYSELSKRVASEFYAPALFSDKVKWLVRMLLKLG